MRRRVVMLVVLIVVLATLAAQRVGWVPRWPKAIWRPRRVESNVKQRLPEHPPVAGERVMLVRKADRVLVLYINGKLAASYAIALGWHPEGHKRRRGDSCTPEGNYYVCTRNANSSFHLFLGLSYPNAEDAEAGFRAGLITQEQRDAILKAVQAKQRPPWDTPLGGEVGIHGGGTEVDWTAGCVALENADVDQLWEILKLGDPVVIEP